MKTSRPPVDALLIRPIEPEEWPLYRAVRLRSLQDAPDAFGSTYEAEVARPDELWSSRIKAGSTSGTDRALFATLGGAVCGLVWCKVAGPDREVADVFQMWVEPSSRGQGVGAALLDAVVSWARDIGVRRLRLGVTAADSPALRLYARFGFEPVGPLEPLRSGSCLMAQTMERVIGVDPDPARLRSP